MGSRLLPAQFFRSFPEGSFQARQVRCVGIPPATGEPGKRNGVRPARTDPGYPTPWGRMTVVNTNSFKLVCIYIYICIYILFI